MKTDQCEICGESFEPREARHKRCSDCIATGSQSPYERRSPIEHHKGRLSEQQAVQEAHRARAAMALLAPKSSGSWFTRWPRIVRSSE